MVKMHFLRLSVILGCLFSLYLLGCDSAVIDLDYTETELYSEDDIANTTLQVNAEGDVISYVLLNSPEVVFANIDVEEPSLTVTARENIDAHSTVWLSDDLLIYKDNVWGVDAGNTLSLYSFATQESTPLISGVVYSFCVNYIQNAIYYTVSSTQNEQQAYNKWPNIVMVYNFDTKRSEQVDSHPISREIQGIVCAKNSERVSWYIADYSGRKNIDEIMILDPLRAGPTQIIRRNDPEWRITDMAISDSGRFLSYNIFKGMRGDNDFRILDIDDRDEYSMDIGPGIRSHVWLPDDVGILSLEDARKFLSVEPRGALRFYEFNLDSASVEQ